MIVWGEDLKRKPYPFFVDMDKTSSYNKEKGLIFGSLVAYNKAGTGPILVADNQVTDEFWEWLPEM